MSVCPPACEGCLILEHHGDAFRRCSQVDRLQNKQVDRQETSGCWNTTPEGRLWSAGDAQWAHRRRQMWAQRSELWLESQSAPHGRQTSIQELLQDEVFLISHPSVCENAVESDEGQIELCIHVVGLETWSRFVANYRLTSISTQGIYCVLQNNKKHLTILIISYIKVTEQSKVQYSQHESKQQLWRQN